MVPVSPTNQDLSNDTPFSQIKSRVPVPLKKVAKCLKNLKGCIYTLCRAVGYRTYPRLVYISLYSLQNNNLFLKNHLESISRFVLQSVDERY